MSDGRLQVARRGDLLVLHLSGELRLLLADALERSIELEIVPGLKRLVIDLQAARFMDSTMIGMLVLAARRASQHTDSPPLLICADGELWQQLVGLHLDGLFQRVDAPPVTLPEGSEVRASEDLDPATQARLVLHAHRALIEQDHRNAETFAGLVAMLEAELAARD